jgi:hypothetical protein
VYQRIHESRQPAVRHKLYPAPASDGNAISCTATGTTLLSKSEATPIALPGALAYAPSKYDASDNDRLLNPEAVD